MFGSDDRWNGEFYRIEESKDKEARDATWNDRNPARRLTQLDELYL